MSSESSECSPGTLLSPPRPVGASATRKAVPRSPRLMSGSGWAQGRSRGSPQEGNVAIVELRDDNYEKEAPDHSDISPFPQTATDIPRLDSASSHSKWSSRHLPLTRRRTDDDLDGSAPNSPTAARYHLEKSQFKTDGDSDHSIQDHTLTVLPLSRGIAPSIETSPRPSASSTPTVVPIYQSTATLSTKSAQSDSPWQQECLVWQSSDASNTATSAFSRPGLFAKAPLIREVPAVRKRIAKRESTYLANSAERSEIIGDRSEHKVLGSSRSSFAHPPGMPTSGTWRQVIAILLDTGVLTLSLEGDAACTIDVPSLACTDVSLANPTLLARSHCLSIRIPSPLYGTASPFMPVSPNTRANSSYTPFLGLGRSESTNVILPTTGSHERTAFVYLGLPSDAAAAALLVMLRCHTRAPELPHSMWNNGKYSLFRLWRSIHLDIVEVRALSERALAGSHTHLKLAPSDSTTDESVSTNGVEVTASVGQTRANSASMGRMPSRDNGAARERLTNNDIDNVWTSNTTQETFCDVVFEDDVIGNTATKRGTSTSFWREPFLFT